MQICKYSRHCQAAHSQDCLQLPPLAHLKALTHLEVSYNQIRSIASLSALQQASLLEFYAASNKICAIQVESHVSGNGRCFETPLPTTCKCSCMVCFGECEHTKQTANIAPEEDIYPQPVTGYRAQLASRL